MGCGPFNPFDPGAPPECGGCDPLSDPLCTGIPPIVVVSGGGGVDPGSLNDAINSLGNQLTGMIQAVSDLVTKILHALAPIIAAIAAVWSNVLKPAIDAIAKALKKINGWLDKILKPYLDQMQRIRKALEDVYNIFLRPIIGIIQRVRQVLRILSLFHVGFARRLDARLAAIEAAILKPYLKLLARTNSIGNWVSFILNSQLLIYRALLLGSIKANAGGTLGILTSAPQLGVPPLPPGAITPAADPTPAFLEQVKLYTETRAGEVNSLIAIAAGAQTSIRGELPA